MPDFILASLEEYKAAFFFCVVLHNWCRTDMVELSRADQDLSHAIARLEALAKRARQAEAAAAGVPFGDDHVSGMQRRANLMVEMTPPLATLQSRVLYLHD